MNAADPAPGAELRRLAQLRHLDLLALALRQVPGCGDETARYYARMSRDGLLDLLTRKASR